MNMKTSTTTTTAATTTAAKTTTTPPDVGGQGVGRGVGRGVGQEIGVLARYRAALLARYRAAVLATRGTNALAVLGPGATRDLLVAFDGDPHAALRWVLQLATDVGKPFGLHLAGRTLFFPPAGWSHQRLAGYVAARHQELEAAFGPAAGVEVLGPAATGQPLEDAGAASLERPHARARDL